MVPSNHDVEVTVQQKLEIAMENSDLEPAEEFPRKMYQVTIGQIVISPNRALPIVLILLVRNCAESWLAPTAVACFIDISNVKQFVVQPALGNVDRIQEGLTPHGQESILREAASAASQGASMLFGACAMDTLEELPEGVPCDIEWISSTGNSTLSPGTMVHLIGSTETCCLGAAETEGVFLSLEEACEGSMTVYGSTFVRHLNASHVLGVANNLGITWRRDMRHAKKVIQMWQNGQHSLMAEY